MTFGEKLLKLRTSKKISQEQMAELLDVSRQSISKWESDKSFPEIKRILFLSEYFNISLDYLLKNEEEINKPKIQTYHSSSLKDCLIDFITNLTDSQKRALYFLLTIGLSSFCLVMCYLLGIGVGKFIYNLAH